MVVTTGKWLTRVAMIAIAVLSVLDGCGRTGLLDTSAPYEVDASASQQGPGAAAPITSANGSAQSAATFTSGSSATSGSSSVTGSSSISGSDASVFGSSSATTSASSATTSASSSSGAANGPPSCQGGLGTTDCGPGGRGNESCCTSLPVTGGTYYRTYTNLGSGPTSEADPATVSGFRLDRYLVTVGRFLQYLNYLTSSSGAPPADGTGIHTHLNGGQGLSNSANPGTYETGWDGANFNAYVPTGPASASFWSEAFPGTMWTSAAAPLVSLPINDVNWYQAYAFCIWDGGFLPSEAEWEYAAAGGSQQREYPWGSTDPGTMNEYAIYGCYYPGSGECTDLSAVAHLAPVGTAVLGAGDWGQLDLAGEVWEWTLDSAADYVDPCTDCAYLSPMGGTEIRGGDFAPGTGLLYPATRGGAYSGVPQNGIGFRCARTP